MRRGPGALGLVALALLLALALSAAAAQTTTLEVVRYGWDNATVAESVTVNVSWMEAHLPVMGDGITPYHFQGPSFVPTDLWNPAESLNPAKINEIVKGTAIRDLCDLVGGMHPGDEVQVRAADGFRKRLNYTNVYAPPARQGPPVLAWWNARNGYAWPDSMRLFFLADTSSNPNGWHVFGNADMKASMPSSEWHYFNGVYPTTTGLSIQSVSELRILSTQSAAPITSVTTRPVTTAATATTAKTTVPTTQATGSATTKATTLPGTTGVTVAPTTAQGATTVPTASAAPTATATSAGTTTARADDGGSVVVTTTGVPAATVSPLPTLTTVVTAILNLTVNGTGTVTPSPTESPVPVATGYDRTYDYSVSTGLDYVTDLEATETATVTPTPTATATVTETPAALVAATPAVTAPPSPPSVLAPSPTAAPNSRAATRSLSFTLSFQVRESGNGPAINASPGGSAAVVSPTSPLGALWAFLKAVVRLIDPFFT